MFDFAFKIVRRKGAVVVRKGRGGNFAAWRPRLPLSLLLVSLSAAGCSDYWFGEVGGSRAEVVSPDGIQSGDVPIDYRLSGDESEASVSVSFSTDGRFFREASEAPGGEGVDNLSVSADGDLHTFVWDSAQDLEGERHSSVVLRITPKDGDSDRTEPFAVHNAFWLVALENSRQGRAHLLWLKPDDHSLERAQSLETLGQDPSDVLFHRDGASGNRFFFVVHETSNDVAAFQLDEETEVLAPARRSIFHGSPFPGDGTGAKYLATNGDRVFVSNTKSESITIFDLDGQTGVLTLSRNSGVSAPGCGALVVWNDTLYVASDTEAAGGILVFDITEEGGLIQIEASPVRADGLSSPGAMVVRGTQLYVANRDDAMLHGFRIGRLGELDPMNSPPTQISSAGVEEIVHNGDRMFGVTGSQGTLLSLSVAPSGVVREDRESPITLNGPSTALESAAGVLVLATTTSRELVVWTVNCSSCRSGDEATVYDAPGEIIRVAASD